MYLLSMSSRNALFKFTSPASSTHRCTQPAPKLYAPQSNAHMHCTVTTTKHTVHLTYLSAGLLDGGVVGHHVLGAAGHLATHVRSVTGALALVIHTVEVPDSTTKASDHIVIK
jgi:hypothetical protein